MTFSSILKRYRDELQFSQIDLAQALNINVATVSRWENGHNIPNVSVAEKLVEIARDSGMSSQSCSNLEENLQLCGLGKKINSVSCLPVDAANQMINSSAHAIYICDCKTYELLFINQTTADMINKSGENAAGKKCYEYIMDRNAPCEFCSSCSKSMHTFIETDFTNPCTQKRYHMRSKQISWNGAMAQIEFLNEATIDNYYFTAIDNMIDCFPFSVGVFHLYPDGRLVLQHANVQFNELLGITAANGQEGKVYELLEYIYGEDRPEIFNILIHTLQKKESANFKARVLTGSEKPVWIQFKGSIAYEDNEKAVLYLYAENIDTQMLHLKELNRGTAVTKYLTRNGYVSFWIYDISNNSIEHLFHISSSEEDKPCFHSGPDEVVANGIIYKDDIPAYLTMYHNIRIGQMHSEAIVRTRNNQTGLYEWNKICLNRVKKLDEDGYAAIGFCINAEYQKELEVRYEYESNVKREQIKSSLAYCRINLTTRKIEEFHSKLIKIPEMVDTASVEEMLQMGILDGIVETDRILVQQILDIDHLIDKYKNGQRSETVIYRRKFPDNSIRWVEGTVSKVRRASTDELIAFYTTRDIDRSRKAQLAVLNVLEEETENIFLINPEQENVQYIMENGSIADFNTENVLYSFDTLKKRILQDAADEDMEKIAAFLDITTIRRRLIKDSVLQITYNIRTGHDFFRKKKARLFYLDDSKIEVLFIQRDITDLHIEEEQKKAILQAAVNKAQLANRAKSDFLANMSHDLRTPLNALFGFTALTMDDADNPELVRRNMEELRNIGEYMRGLIENILDASKLQSTTLQLNPAVYTYDEFKAGIMSMFYAQCERKNISLTFIEPKQPVTIFADKLRFQQIVFNLLSNAVSFTPEGGHICLAIETIRKTNELAWINMVVKDDGIGMSEAFQQEMYEPFTQENTEVRPELHGTGLGLCITRKLVNLMGGAIEIESKIGKGTTATVHFSFQVVSNEANVWKRNMAGTESHVLLQGKTVLLVEDYPINMMIAKRLLEKTGASILTAETGRQAVERFLKTEAGSIDIVLMDIQMPEMDGLEATRQIRASNRADAKTVPIIAMSANAYAEDIEKSISAGMNEHLSKPIDPELFYSTLKKYCC